MKTVRIDRVELYDVAVPMLTPFVTASGTVEHRRIGLVHLLGEGIDGWGECSPIPGYSKESLEAAWKDLSVAGPLLVGRRVDPHSPLEAATPSGRAALEGALWDLSARAAGQPLWRLLGGGRERITAGAVLGLHSSTSALLEEVAGCVAAGYQHVKVKIAPGHDWDELSALRTAQPDLSLGADGNGSYGADDLPALRALDDLGLAYVEQPFPAEDVDTHARLAVEAVTPVCLDEGVADLADAHRAIDTGAADLISVKHARLGGINEALSLHAVAVAAGIPLRIGGMLETGVGRAHAIALATLDGFTVPGDLGASDRLFDPDLVDPPWQLAEGRLEAPVGPGIGVSVDVELVEHRSVRRLSF